jgi:hypothetical protein
MRLRTALTAGVIGVVAASGGSRAQDARPLPDQDVLFAAIRENLVTSEREDDRYFFRERRTDVHRNPFGRIGTGGTRLFEVYPSPTRRLGYRRLVARDDVPVEADDLARQDREYRERVAEVRRDLASRSDADRRRRDEDAAERRARAQRRTDDVLGALQFTLEGRGVYRGAPAVVITFTPRPGARPETREGRTAHRFTGTVWVDEASAEVMHFEAEAVDDISFGFGIIARLHEGATLLLTRRPVGDGVWMPTELRLSGSGRAVLFRRMEIDFRVEWFDYRRLDGASDTPFLDTRVQGEPDARPQ